MSTPARPTRIICYSPYLSWQIHAVWESTMLMALQTDGADVQYLLCDGMYPVCDLDNAFEPRTPFKCNNCQAFQAGFLAQLPFQYQWLNRFLTDDDRRTVSQWVGQLQAMSTEELARATFDGQPLHSWVRPSLHLMFRLERVDINNSDLRNVYIAYMAADALAYRALGRAFDQHKPDVLFVLNGMRGSTKVALVAARERGIRVITHERGGLREKLRLVENEPCNTPDLMARLWANWKDIPLTTDEVHVAASQMKSWAEGTNLNWVRFSPPPGQGTKVHEKLKLDPSKPLWTAFTSSMDEIMGDDAYGVHEMTQNEWLLRTVEFARQHPEVQIVLRQHPNRPIEGPHRPVIQALNPAEITFHEQLLASLPANMRFVPSKSEVSSYDLIDASTVGLTYISTLSVEMASRGMHVIMAGNGGFRGLDFLHAALAPEALDRAYQAALGLPMGHRDAELARQAHRFVYAWFHRWMLHLPMVEMPTLYTGKYRFSSQDELRKGNSADLDRLRRIVFDGEPVIPVPGRAERRRTDADEIAFFGLQPATAASTPPPASPPAP